MQTAIFAGGCFWCTEAVFNAVNGVESAISGYIGGNDANPTYKDICSGATGHAEAVKITFDETKISYADLLGIFFATHDPTTLNRQGADQGTQYRSAVFYLDAAQLAAAQTMVDELTKTQVFPAPIVTALTQASAFYNAEDYHQEYYANNPNQGYCMAVVGPKVSKFRAKFAHFLKK
jgi:peptide-methionine (S)-S-oxide reductase